MDERRLVRRVATAACAVAVLTTPLVRMAVGNDESWVAGNALFLVIGVALLGLGNRRVSLGAALGSLALLLWALSVASLWQLTGVVVAGRQVVSYGSGPLWLAALMGPLMLLAFSIRRAMQFVLAAIAVYALVFVVRAGGAAGDVLLSSGLWFQALATVLVVSATLAVALLAQRSAVAQTEAEELRRHAAEERHELVSAQGLRSVVFSRTATDLRRPMAQLTRAVSELEAAASADVRGSAERVATLSTAVLDDVAGSLRALVTSANADWTQDDASNADAADADDAPDAATARRRDLVDTAVVIAVVLAVIVDALWLAQLLQSAAPDAAALAVGGSRMVLVLFLGAAIIAVRRPDRFGWSAVAASLLVHPIAVLRPASGGASSLAMQTLAPAWRNSLLATVFILLLSAIIERRVRAGDAARQEAAVDAASSRELRRQHAAAERAYAEAAHELKNPLTVVSAGARTLWRGPTLSEQQTTQLRDAVGRSTARLDDRLREMRAVAGISEDDAPAATAVALDVCSALEALAAATSVATEASQIELDLQCDGAQVAIVRDHLDHVMENLLGNAHAYGEPGGPVQLLARVDDGDVHIEVANRGGSLTSAQAQHVFEPYWRASDSLEHPTGSGLGLAIVARLVDGWNGMRWCSVADGWTRMGFTIPLSARGGGSTGGTHAPEHIPTGAG